MRRSTSQVHLERRPSGYYWRRRWPRQAAAAQTADSGPRRFLGFALRTDFPADARTLASRLTRMSDQVFLALREKTMTIAAAEADRILTELIRFELAAFEQARAVAPARSVEMALAERAREEAVLATLRDALWLRDREAVRAPLRATATRLGLHLDETDATWAALAIEATRALVEVCEERMRRDRGQYAEPSALFRAAAREPRGAAETSGTAPPLTQTTWAGRLPPVDVTAHFASGDAGGHPLAHPSATPVVPPPRAAEEPLSAEGSGRDPGVVTAPSIECGRPSGPVPEVREDGPREGALAVPPPRASRTRPVPYPKGMTAENAIPGPFNACTWPGVDRGRLNVDVTKLSSRCQNALLGDHPITLSEVADLFLELKLAGYEDDFDKKQKSLPDKAVDWRKSSFGNREMAVRLWLDLLGDRPLDDLNEYEIEDVVALIARLPAKHGKAWRDVASFRDLVDQVDREEELGKAAAEAQAHNMPNLTPGKRAALIRDRAVPRIAVDTFLRHVRTGNAIARMARDLGRIKFNAFWLCSYTKKEVDEMKKSRGSKLRMAWDDRIAALYRSRKFQEELEDVGDPLFWAPLMAHHMGFRMEEVLQLGPDDVTSRGGVAVVHVHGGNGNAIKSPAADRHIPVHPNLLELGLLQLVELRRKEGESKLFPNLGRGQTKGSLSELFTKAFGYYRRSNQVYWLGLDFHALRTTFNQAVEDAAIPGSHRRRLMGHSPLDEGENPTPRRASALRRCTGTSRASPSMSR